MQTKHTPSQPKAHNAHWTMAEVGAALDDMREGSGSLRQRAAAAGAPYSTARRWNGWVDGPLAAFCLSAAGLAFIHRLVLALNVVMTKRNPCGLRMVAEVLELSGLSQFVGASFGSLQRMGVRIEEEVVAFEAHEQPALVEKMRPRSITLVEDETFHPATCLVAMEPVSGFVFVEGYREQRDQKTWDDAVLTSLNRFGGKVHPWQVTSDGALALHAHARNTLKAAHSPDLFHGQHDVLSGTMLALSAKLTARQKTAEEALLHVQSCVDARDAADGVPRGPGRPRDHEARILEGYEAQVAADTAVQEAQARNDDMVQDVRNWGAAYHPYDLTSGAPRTADQFRQEAGSVFEKIKAIVAQAQLSERSKEAVEKASRLLEPMADVLHDYHRRVGEKVAALSVTTELKALCLTVLVPALYLLRAAAKAPNSEARHSIQAVATGLLAQLTTSQAWMVLDLATQASLQAMCQDCADFFQRSSSCVEGRNGRLSQHHHGKHRLSARFLHCLTIIHNYMIRRADGTTAAQRLFGMPHADLFEWLVDRVPMLPLPRHPGAVVPGPTLPC